jgi:hypothetical protein
MTDDVFKSYGADTFGANDFVGDVYLIGDRHLFVDAELADPIFFGQKRINKSSSTGAASFLNDAKERERRQALKRSREGF